MSLTRYNGINIQWRLLSKDLNQATTNVKKFKETITKLEQKLKKEKLINKSKALAIHDLENKKYHREPNRVMNQLLN